MTYIDPSGNVYEEVSIPIGMYGQALATGGGLEVTNALTVNQAATGLLELASLHATLLTGNNLIASGTGDDKAKQDPTYIAKRPWLEMPEGGVPFDPANTIDLPNLVLPSGNTLVVQHTVPDGYDGVINAYSWNFLGGGATNTGDLVVQLLRDGVPIRNYDNITVEKGTVAIARPISPLRIYSKQVISLVINHVANPLLNGEVTGSMVGYDYPAMS